MDNLTEQQIVDKFLPIPYVDRGRLESGIDCWGLCIEAYKMKGVELIDPEDYSKQYQVKFLDEYYKYWIAVKQFQLMDLCVFEGKESLHCGIMLNSNDFIHATVGGVVVSSITAKEWNKHLIGVYRYNG